MKPRAEPLGHPANGISDPQALAEIALGRVTALAVIYDRYHPCLYRFFANATGHGADVDDLVQNAFLAAARAAGSFDGRQSCRQWLLAIAAGTLFRRRRTFARWSRVLRDFASSQKDMYAEVERQVVAKDELKATARALSKISEKKRVVLLLSDLEDLSCAEIAETLGIPIGTVWTRLHHARRELRAAVTSEASQ